MKREGGEKEEERGKWGEVNKTRGEEKKKDEGREEENNGKLGWGGEVKERRKQRG